jgi:hypothetical protein
MFIRNGHHVLWATVASGSTIPLPPSLLSAEGELMEELLHEFLALFQEPTGLPPPQNMMHMIHLLPGTMLVAVQPYRYAHA